MNLLAPGTAALVRYVWRDRVLFAEPATIVEDRSDRVVTFLSAGSKMKWTWIDYVTGTMDGPGDYEWHSTDVVKIFEYDAWFAVWAMWKRDGGPFLGWYVDFQEPIRRTPRGIDSWDLSLDIVVAPDLRWHWKDEDHFARIQELGWITPGAATSVRAAAAQVIKRIEERAAPFNEPWPNWRPDPDWSLPDLPFDWAR